MKRENKAHHRACLRSAVFIVGLYLLAHIAGFRSHTSVLAGTNTAGLWGHFAGSVYLLLHVSAVCFAPVLSLAGAFLWCDQRLVGVWRGNE